MFRVKYKIVLNVPGPRPRHCRSRHGRLCLLSYFCPGKIKLVATFLVVEDSISYACGGIHENNPARHFQWSPSPCLYQGLHIIIMAGICHHSGKKMCISAKTQDKNWGAISCPYLIRRGLILLGNNLFQRQSRPWSV